MDWQRLKRGATANMPPSRLADFVGLTRDEYQAWLEAHPNHERLIRYWESCAMIKVLESMRDSAGNADKWLSRVPQDDLNFLPDVKRADSALDNKYRNLEIEWVEDEMSEEAQKVQAELIKQYEEEANHANASEG